MSLWVITVLLVLFIVCGEVITDLFWLLWCKFNHRKYWDLYRSDTIICRKCGQIHFK